MHITDPKIYEAILESTLAGYWDWNIQENTEYLSPTFKQMFGYEDHEMENTPEAWQKIIHPDDLKTVLKCFEEHVKSKGEIPYDNRVRYYHKNGSIVWVLCKGKVIEWSETGEPIRMIGSHIDISEEVNLSEQLRKKEMENVFQNVIDSAPLSMVMINEDGEIVFTNKETEKLFGYSFEELKNQKLEVLLPDRFKKAHPEQRNVFFKKPIARRMGEGRELFGLNKDGSEFPVEIGLNPLKIKGKSFVLSAIIDITERKKVEKLFKASVESAPLALIMINRKGTVVLSNKEAQLLFGYTKQELENSKIEALLPERFRNDHPNKRASFFKAPSSRRMGEGRELFGLRKDGSEFPVEIGLNPVELSDDTYVLSAIVDITERKKIEKSEKELFKKVRESNEELEQFAFVAAHDLKTPLRAISSYSTFLVEDYKERLDDQGKKYIENIYTNVEFMKALIEDLLSFSRVNYEEEPFEIIDLNKLIHILEIKFQSLNHKVQFNVEKLPKIKGVYTQITQVFTNLLENGIQYNTSDIPKITISSISDQNKIIIYIEDNGIGISEEHYEKIFRIFQRLHSKNDYFGTGIGLALCQKIINRHGGKIEVESIIGKGSTFKIILTKENII